MSEYALQIEGLGKKYKLGKKSSQTLRGAISDLFQPRKKTSEFWALKDIDFNIKKGEAVGIIGRNGAGKSTLLKILSRITPPSKGRAIVDGRLSSLLEVGTGFHGELTGRENIYLNGSLLGMTRQEIKNNFDEIIDFSGVEQFIDTPVKHYSSGMYVRLAFSVAAHLNAEILLIDEVLAVGDAEFQKKCLGKMNQVVNTGRTVLFVSHNFDAVRKFCDKCITLDKGHLKSFTSTQNAIIDFAKHGNAKGLNYKYFTALKIEGVGKGIVFKIKLNKKIKYSGINIRIDIKDQNGNLLFVCNNKWNGQDIQYFKESNYIECSVLECFLFTGNYFAKVLIIANQREINEETELFPFSFVGSGFTPPRPQGLNLNYHFESK